MPSREEVVVLQQRLQQELAAAERKHNQALHNELKLLMAGISSVAVACIQELTKVEFHEEFFLNLGVILIFLALYADLGRAEPEKEISNVQNQLNALAPFLDNDTSPTT